MKTVLKKKKNISHKKPKENPFPIVAIGASLGGLDAMRTLLKSLPPDTGMAYIYIQHISSDHKSFLSPVLSKITKMKVQEIEDMEHLAPNNVYVIPHNKIIAVTDGRIQLLPRPKNSSTISIDVLFSSLAETHKENVIGIVLSGNAKDGTIGLKAIKEAGGLTFAEDDYAQEGSMPKSAIDSGVVDFILSPKEIANELARFSERGFIRDDISGKHEESSINDNDPDLKVIFELLHKETGVDFNHYKMATIKRRLNHKMNQCGVKTVKQYVKLLHKKDKEVRLLYKDLLINVTNFFRDAEVFRYLKTTMLPKLLKSKAIGETLRIWVPACSTGQEAYSIAMLLTELQDNKIKKTPVQIFATDLSEKAIADARIGIYSPDDLKAVSKKQLERFFVKTGNSYQIIKELREICVFAPHNILRDPPFSRMDFISCRNLLIYFDSAAQKKVIATLHFALNDIGYLMLGKAETIGTSLQLFTGVNNKLKIYSRKKNTGVRKIPELATNFPIRNSYNKKVNHLSKSTPVNPTGIDNAIDTVLLSHYMPACAVINKDMETLQFRGPISLFLQPSPGKASLNILKMTRPEFALELRNAIHTAIKTKLPVHKSGIEIKIESVLQIMSLEVRPLKIEWDEPLLLIVFTLKEQVEKFISIDKSGKSDSIHKDLRIKKLTEELNSKCVEMNSIIESQEATYEQLQAANEEIVSTNEEFQTLNEELETSKEEIETTNEELISSNLELQMRHDLLVESYEYSEAIIATCHEPMLVLTKNFHVKSANKSFYKKFLVKKEDTEGMSLFELGNMQWNIPKLRTMLQDIISKNSGFENFEVAHNFPVIGEKIMMLNAQLIVQKSQSEQLILLAFQDNTDRSNFYLKAKHSLSLIEASLDPLITINTAGKITDMNQATVNITGITRKNLTGSNFFDYFTQPIKARNVYKEVFAEGFVADSALTIRHKTGKLTDVLFNGSVYKDDKGNVLGVVVVARDVTAQKLLSKYSLSLIEASLDPLVTINPEGKITDMNEATANITGITRKNLIGTDFFDYFTEPQNAREVYKQVFAKGSVADSPLTLRHKNGKLTDVLFNGSVYKDDRGNVLGVVVVARDVTAQKLLSKYSLSLIEASLDPLVTINPEGKITDMNEATANITGITRKNLIGTDFFDYFTEPQKAREVYQTVFAEGSVADSPLTLRHKNGKLTDVLFNGSVYKDDRGKVLGIVIVARDVTEQKKITDNLKQSLKEISDYKFALDESSIVAITDQKGIINYVNDNFCKVSKYTRQELIGQTHRIISSQDHPKEFIGNLWTTIATGKIWRGELKNRAKDGSIYWVATTIVPFLNEHGKPYQYVAIRSDITESKKIEEEMKAAKLSAELATEIAEEAQIVAENATQVATEAVKSKQQFLSNMSHEIRTPMNAIIGFTNVVLKTSLDEKQKEYLNAIKISGDTLIVLINDILDLAKVDSGLMTIEKKPFKLAASISAMMHLFETKIQEKNIELITQYDPAIPEILLGDSIRLHQIILNLISNAVKFTEKGKITVCVQLLSEDKAKATIKFTISDTGIGIPEDRQTCIFDAFQQASSETSRLYGGTGLGLSIVKKLVEIKGGSILVKSKIGEGSAFSFILDFQKTNAEPEREIDLPIELQKEIKKVKVLVVEDILLNQLLMKTVLEDFGFDLDTASNGRIAIELLKKNTYDIILMDLQMPEMNGFETTTYIRTTMNSPIPIIALSADVTTVDVEKCKAIGMNDYIAKPINDRLLYSKIIKNLKQSAVTKKINTREEQALQKNKCINLNYLKQLTKNNSGIIEMIEVYLKETPVLISAMKQAIDNKNWESLRMAAHSIRPSFSMMGIDEKFENTAKKIQEYATSLHAGGPLGQEKKTAKLSELFLKIETVCAQAFIESQGELNALRVP